MAKYVGKIGFAETYEKEPGKWKERIVEREYRYEVIRNNRRLESSGGINDNININNEITILRDPYVDENFHAMRYAEFMGTRWKVVGVEAMHPRLKLTLGGVYNG